MTRWAIEWEPYFRIVPLFQQESLWYSINLIANIVVFSKNQLRLCPEAVKSQIFTRSWVWGATEKDKTWLNRLISCRPEIRLWSVGPVPASLRQHQKSFRHHRICSLLSFHYSHLFRSHVWIRLQCQLKTIWFKPIWKRFFLEILVVHFVKGPPDTGEY